MKVIVIGGGPSGIIAALCASTKHQVTLLEGNDKTGKKLLLTGNGRCNYWNSFIDQTKYTTNDEDSLKIILNYKKIVLDYLSSLGIIPKIKDGYYYPYSNTSQSIKKIFDNELKRNNVDVIYNYKVDNIDYIDKEYVIYSKNECLKADKVILACGGITFPKTGSDGSGYKLAQKFNHTLIKPYPALTPLLTNTKKDWDGVRCEGTLSLFIDDKFIKEETGEIQFNKQSISGICTFNLSNKIVNNFDKDIYLKINFLKSICNNFDEWMENRNRDIPNHTIEELLESIFNYKLLNVLLNEAKISKKATWKQLNKEEKKQLKNTLTSYQIKIIGYADEDRSQVTLGGIPLKEINPQTMESKKSPNLYLIGEMLNVTGDCGGYNLAFAFLTGYIAGVSV